MAQSSARNRGPQRPSPTQPVRPVDPPVETKEVPDKMVDEPVLEVKEVLDSELLPETTVTTSVSEEVVIVPTATYYYNSNGARIIPVGAPISFNGHYGTTNCYIVDEDVYREQWLPGSTEEPGLVQVFSRGTEVTTEMAAQYGFIAKD